MGRKIQGYWDCKYCDTVGIKADPDNKHCPNCLHPQEEGTKFYMKSTTEYVDDETVKKAGAGPNWVCGYCDSYNKFEDSECKKCGGNKDGSEGDYFSKQKEQYSSSVKDFEKESTSYDEKPSWTEPKPSTNTNFRYKKRININLKSILSFILVLVIASVGIYALIPKEDELLIEDISWERNISIEELRTFDESDWYLPSGARLKYHKEEFSHYDKVISHYNTITEQVPKQEITGYTTVVTGHRDLGNGLFEEITTQQPQYTTVYETVTRQEPVYKDVEVRRTKYYYEIDRWTPHRNIKTSGKTKDIYWGDYVLANKEREGNRTQHYYALATNKKDKQYKYTFDYEEWNTLKIGQIVKVMVGIGNHAKFITK